VILDGDFLKHPTRPLNESKSAGQRSHMNRRHFLGAITVLPAALAACRSARTPDPAEAPPPEPKQATAAPAPVKPTDLPPAKLQATAAQVEPTRAPATAPAPTAAPEPTAARVLPEGPLAPEIRSESWINSAPVAWDSLRGRVVMIEFWTFG
jgi:hypothetical protein